MIRTSETQYQSFTHPDYSRTPLSILLPELALGSSSIIPQPFNVHVMSPVLGSPISRRLVLTGTTAGVASLLVPITVFSTYAQSRKEESTYDITDWIAIAPTGDVTLGLSQPEVGQGRTRSCRRFSQMSSTPIGSASLCGL
jgi:hypothetical protein